MLFIHGDEDTFVPFEMLDKVYRATKGPKEKYVVKEPSMRKHTRQILKISASSPTILSQYVH